MAGTGGHAGQAGDVEGAPSPHEGTPPIQRVKGTQTTRLRSTRNLGHLLNLAASAKAPVMRAGVVAGTISAQVTCAAAGMAGPRIPALHRRRARRPGRGCLGGREACRRRATARSSALGEVRRDAPPAARRHHEKRCGGPPEGSPPQRITGSSTSPARSDGDQGAIHCTENVTPFWAPACRLSAAPLS